MLYTCFSDFFNHASKSSRLPREDEKAYAKRMKEGDKEAQKILTDSYLFVLAAFLKRQAVGQPSLELVYKGLSVLEDTIPNFDFQQDNLPFSRHLETKLKQMTVRYIADRSL